MRQYLILNEAEINQKQDKVSSKSSLISKFAEIKFSDLLLFHQPASAQKVSPGSFRV